MEALYFHRVSVDFIQDILAELMEQLQSVRAKDSEAKLWLVVSILNNSCLHLLELFHDGITISSLLREDLIHVISLVLPNQRFKPIFFI